MSGKPQESFQDNVLTRIALNGRDVSIRHQQDVTALLNVNQAQANGRTDSQGGAMRKIASIDLVTWADLCRRGIAKDPKALRKWLRDRDNRAFTTYRGRI